MKHKKELIFHEEEHEFLSNLKHVKIKPDTMVGEKAIRIHCHKNNVEVIASILDFLMKFTSQTVPLKLERLDDFSYHSSHFSKFLFKDGNPICNRCFGTLIESVHKPKIKPIKRRHPLKNPRHTVDLTKVE